MNFFTFSCRSWVLDLLHPLIKLRLGRQLAGEQEIGDFEIRAALGELLDRVAAVLQDRRRRRRCR
jgi:hypothetical protein